MKAQRSLPQVSSRRFVLHCPPSWWVSGKTLPAMQETDSIPDPGRCPGEGNGNPLQYSCLKNPHGQRNLSHYSTRGLKESDMTEGLNNSHNPLSESHLSSQATLIFTVSDTAYASYQGLLVPLAAKSPDNAAPLAKGQPAQKSHFLSFQKLFIPK